MPFAACMILIVAGMARIGVALKATEHELSLNQVLQHTGIGAAYIAVGFYFFRF